MKHNTSPNRHNLAQQLYSKTYRFGIDGNLSKALAFAPEQGVGLIAEQGLPDASWGDAQQVAVPQGLYTLLLGPMHHAEHFQQQFKPWHRQGHRELL